MSASAASLAVASLIAGLAAAALALPSLDFVYPAGGTAGSVLFIEAGGQDIGLCKIARFSGDGLEATYIGPAVRYEKNAAGKRQSVEIPGRLRFKVVIADDASPGIHSFRIGTAYRLTEPVHFEVARDSELAEADRQRIAPTNMAVAVLPVCINGCAQASPDIFRFKAAAGSEIVALPSPVKPFGAPPVRLEFADAAGKKVAAKSFAPADPAALPALVMQAPADGEYALEVSSPTNFAGNIYRIRLGQLPLITRFSPDRAPYGDSLNISLEGANLPSSRVRLFTGGKDAALCLKAIAGDALMLPGLKFTLETEEEAMAPDFTVRVAPATLNIPSRGSAPLRLYVERRSGFTGDVQVKLDYPPLGICAEGGLIPAGASEGRMTVSTDGPRFPRVPFNAALSAVAAIGGAPVSRPVIPFRTAEMLSFGEIAAQCSAGLMSFRLDLGKSALAIPLKAGIRVSSVKSVVTRELGTTYEPFVAWPPSGASAKAVGSGSAAIGISLDAGTWKAGQRGTLLLGLRVRKTGIPIAYSQCVPFVVK